MTILAIVSNLMERLQFLFAETNPESELRRARVNAELVRVHALLKKIIEQAEANSNFKEAISFGAEVMRLSYNFEDLIETYLLEDASRRKGFHLNRIFRRSSRQIKVIEKVYRQLAGKIIEASEHLDSIQIVEVRQIPGPQRFQTPAAAVEYARVTVGKEDEIEDLTYSLIKGNSQLTLVSICGPGGLGKTTLARTLLRNERIIYHFSVRAWSRVSKRYETRQILQEILFSILETWDYRRRAMDVPEDELADLIYKSLKGRQYLIVLEDVWSADAWFSLRMAFPDDNNGSRILFTTRMLHVAKRVGCPSACIHLIRYLNIQESVKLFRHTAGLDNAVVMSSEMKMIEALLLHICDGLPLSIVVVASALKGRTIEEWKLVVEHLNDYRKRPNQPLFEVKHFALLYSCYKMLPHYLRPCLIYFGNFPEAAKIEMDTLFKLWIAEGLISMETLRDGETMMHVAARNLDELVQKNFVTMAEEEFWGQKRFRSCSIHNLIRDFCKETGKDDGIFEVIDLEDENQANNEVSEVIDSRDENQTNNEVSEVIDSRDGNQATSSAFRRTIYLDKYEWTDAHLGGGTDYLRSLVFFSSGLSGQWYIKPREISNLERFIWLRVLCFFGVDFKDGKFPKGVEKLTYLRYLSFRECYLEELSSCVSKMWYLQTLDLRVRNECEMIIPDVFGNLEKLRYLYFPLAYKTAHNQGKLRLGRLKELELLDIFDTNMCNAEDLCGLINLKQLTLVTEGDASEIERILKALECNATGQLRSISLQIRNFDCHSRRRFSAAEEVFNASALHVLEVQGHLGKLPVFDRISSKLTEITLNGSELVQDPMQKLQELPNLSILVLEIEAYIGDKMKCSSGFLKLRYLKLSKLYHLKYWEVEEGAMPSLRTLVIENCKNLRMLPHGFKHCKLLKKLEIASMPAEFVGRIQKSDGTEGEDFYKIKHVQPNVKIDGQHLILKERQQAGPREDPQSRKSLGQMQETPDLISPERP